MVSDRAPRRASAPRRTIWASWFGTAGACPRNYAEAAKWYRRAADLDYAEAQYNLGILYQDGLGIPQDYAEAAAALSPGDQPNTPRRR